MSETAIGEMLRQMTAEGWRNFPEKHPVLLWEDAPGYDAALGQDQPSITPYLLPGTQARGAVVVCPGGGYAFKAMHEAEPIALWLNDAGYHAFVLNYRVAPYRQPLPRMDAQRAIRMVRARAEAWHVKPDKIGILGFSAGGHLAASVMTADPTGDAQSPDPVTRTSARPDAVLLCYPVISLEQGVTHAGSRECLLGPDAPAEVVWTWSMEEQVRPGQPPVFLWHTVEDDAVPVENSLRMLAACKAAGVAVEAHLFPHGHHGLGLAQADATVSQWPGLAAQFLRALEF